MIPTWQCPRCGQPVTDTLCPRCQLAHGSADRDCTWTAVPDDTAADSMWIIQQCPHGLSRFITAGNHTA